MKRVAVVGAGAWGTALAGHAARLGHEVCLWAHEPEVVESVNDRHENALFLPGIGLPAGLRASADLAQTLAGTEIVIFAPPAQHLRAVSAAAAGHVAAGALVLVASKGIEESSLKLLSDVMAETIPRAAPTRLGFLSGPSFAAEVARGLPTDVVVASREMALAREAQRTLHAPAFRVYASDDAAGVQVGGALKNVIAVAAGACDGLKLGTNARAAIITRGLAEITRLGVALGASPLTFLGLAGVGDLVLTCTGELSRNRALGLSLALGTDPRAYIAGRRSVAEGFYTCAAAHALAGKLGVDMPISEQVYAVLHRGRPLREALRRLMERASKEELLGIRAQR
ncbi:MAG: NAD(P)-dependent glycerol-3-phosphate dehydrogenase [Elusimicrobia bacterium]|nr:NAD(P)-dependent glycerol-3-phosphate dehydrogenase [Elusimicrobiota bacterium]